MKHSSKESAVEFPGNHRIHIALAAKNLGSSRHFYESLLGVSPTKIRKGYIKFEPEDPSVNLTLNQVEEMKDVKEGCCENQGPAHFGVQVKSTDAVQSAIRRLNDAGLMTSVENDTTCCYAVQDKVWATDPDGNRWEVFVVLEADAEHYKNTPSDCCAEDTVQSTECC